MTTSRRRQLVAMTTTKPSSSLTPGGGGGCLIVVDPTTGAVLTSLRASADPGGKYGLGLSSLSTFPSSFASTATAGSRHSYALPALAYGGHSAKKGDTYAMLVSIRPGGTGSPPILHWKCRLPESDLTSTGLLVSPCGYYAVGGGLSGSCYIWSTVAGGGKLLRTWNAHYRPVKALAWSDCGKFLVSGGADGMVHVFSLIDLVTIDATNRSTRNGTSRTVPPTRTFSVHHFPVSSLVSIPSGRVISASEDGLLVIFEIFSGNTVLKVQMPHGVTSLSYDTDDGRIFVGSNRGVIYAVDLNAYAMHQTERHGASIAKRRRQSSSQMAGGRNVPTSTFEERVFGSGNERTTINTNSDDTVPRFQTDWVGHNYSVTSLKTVTEDNLRLLVSGDSMGQVRIWDLDSRMCLKILHPWSSTGSSTAQSKSTGSDGKVSNKNSSAGHPVTSICTVSETDYSVMNRSGIFHQGSSSKNTPGIANMIPPLHKYADMATDSLSLSAGELSYDSNQTDEATTAITSRVPFARSKSTSLHASYWEARPILRKRRLGSTSRPPEADTDDTERNVGDKRDGDNEAEEIDDVNALKERLANLEERLKEKESTIERWQTVNNKLMERLQGKSS